MENEKLLTIHWFRFREYVFFCAHIPHRVTCKKISVQNIIRDEHTQYIFVFACYFDAHLSFRVLVFPNGMNLEI